MNNTVMVESKIRQKLRLACALLCVFSLCFLAVIICIVQINNQNLSGQVSEQTVVIREVYAQNSNTLTCENDLYFNVVWDDEEVGVNWNYYVGKSITLITPQKTFGGSNPWVLGLVVNGQTVVDYHDTLNAEREQNDEYKLIFTVVCAVICAVTCGAFIWRFNIKPFVEKTLYHEFAEFLAERQPVSPERRRFVLASCLFCALVVVLMLITSIVISTGEESETMTVADIVILSVFGGTTVSGAVAMPLINRLWVIRREIDFYADNLPFDFSDISHAKLRPKIKNELQAAIRKEREQYPDLYSDGGNGYDVEFKQNGITLKAPTENEESTITAPTAEEIFDYTENGASNNPSGLTESTDGNAMFLTYEQLRFEAVAHYRKGSHPMMIIVKSRLERTDYFPEEFVNDIHIALDSNLMKTLQKFNVSVDNLDYLLENKKALMLENCLPMRKNASKMTK